MRLPAYSVILLLLGCTSAQFEPVGEFSAEYPKNYLTVHIGSPKAFYSARCFEYSTVEDLSTPRAKERLTTLFAERLPQLKPCEGEWPRLLIEFRIGRGVSLHHAEADPTLPYSGFAFVALQNDEQTLKREDPADALAEWQYWRGGSSATVMQQFVFDLTNLFVNHQEEPVPQDIAPN